MRTIHRIKGGSRISFLLPASLVNGPILGRPEILICKDQDHFILGEEGQKSFQTLADRMVT